MVVARLAAKVILRDYGPRCLLSWVPLNESVLPDNPSRRGVVPVMRAGTPLGGSHLSFLRTQPRHVMSGTRLGGQTTYRAGKNTRFPKNTF